MLMYPVSKREGCMPLNSKNKNAKANGAKKAGSAIKAIFKRYNPEKVTIDGIKNFFGFIFYRVGYNIEVNSLLVYRHIEKIADKVYRKASRIFSKVADFFDKLTGANPAVCALRAGR